MPCRRAFFLALLLLVTAALPLLGGCNCDDENAAPVGLAPRKVSAEPAASLDQRLVDGNTAFGFMIWQVLLDKEEHHNILISPASISTALAMTANGADGATFREIMETLRLPGMDLEELNAAFADLQSVLRNSDPEVELNVANSLWARQGVSLNEQFLQRNRDYYAAVFDTLDFEKPAAVSTINRWVEQQTGGKIKKIIEDPIDPLTFLFLINALYFNGAWSDEFDPQNTREIPFTLSDGTRKDHPVMFREGAYRYFQGNDFEAIRLPYGKNRRVGMTVFLPAADSSLVEFQRQLTPENWAGWQLSFSEMDGKVGLPRFQFEYEVSLKEILRTMGMECAFEPRRADFSRMISAMPGPYISEVKHKTYVDVDEKGTEAAAVTSVEFRCTSARPDRFSMIIDRPFFFAITDEKTGAILFLGSVNNP